MPLTSSAMVAAGKVGAADRTGEQDVAGKQVLAAQQGDPARRMTREMDDLASQFAEGNRVPIAQQPVGSRRRLGAQTVDLGMSLRLLQQRQIEFMDQQFGTGGIDQRSGWHRYGRNARGC